MASTNGNVQEDNFVSTPGRKREFLAFLKSIRSFKGDLSSFTAPAFLLSSTSMTEFPTYWAEQPSIFVAPAAEADPEKRSVLVLKWYLTTLKQQYGKRDGKKRKPLNPFLGELFLGHFQDEMGKTELVSEQVSHHPPVTAYYIWNVDHGVHMYGYNAQKTYFSGTIHIDKIGYVLLHLDKWDEDYLITLPNMHLEGLFPPPPYPELESKTYIHSSSGFTAEIDYSGKGWLRGKKNSFTANLYHSENPKHTLFTAEGQWQNGSFAIKDAETKTLLETYDTTNVSLTPLTVAPIEEQDPLESRKAWYKVARAIESGDMTTVGVEKSKIEEEQRALRKTEKIEGTKFPTRYFTIVDTWPVLEELAGKIGHEVDVGSTHGIWKWDEEKYAKVNSSV